MADVTKKDIKDAVVEAFQPFAKAIQTDFNEVKTDLRVVKTDLIEVKISIKKVEERLDGVENRLDALENKFHQLLVLLQKKEEELRLFGAQMKQLEERVAKLEARKG